MNQLTILFAMHFESGHIMSSFYLAKNMKSLGHNVVYLCIPDFKDLIENQGFETVMFAEDIMPSGYNGKHFPSNKDRLRYNEDIFSKYIDYITDGTLDNCLISAKADIILCDPFLSYVAVRALFLKIPAMHLFSSLFLFENQDIPPIISSLGPGSRLITLMAWKIMFLKFFFVKRLKNSITKEFRFPTRMHHLVSAYLDVCKKSGYPCKKDITYRLNEIGFNLVIPSIILCTKAFQFPGNIPEQRLYLGDFVDFERKEIPMEIGFDNRPLIYCSLGTAASTYPYANHFYKAVVAAGSLRDDWRFILQISDPHNIKKYNSTQNVLVSSWVPQLSLLRNASVAVTHGGLNSIMECVGLQVPMVIVPGMRDQPGNASRAVFHDIALTTSMKYIEPSNLINLIEEAMNSKIIKDGLKKMKEKIDEENGLAECISFIESFAAPRK